MEKILLTANGAILLQISTSSVLRVRHLKTNFDSEADILQKELDGEKSSAVIETDIRIVAEAEAWGEGDSAALEKGQKAAQRWRSCASAA